jgi:hypothetical protein
MEKRKSKGSEHMKQITAKYNAYSAAVRKAVLLRLRLHNKIEKFPKKERALYEEQLQKYKERIHGKDY